jgi:hypothetical protein
MSLSTNAWFAVANVGVVSNAVEQVGCYIIIGWGKQSRSLFIISVIDIEVRSQLKLGRLSILSHTSN